MKLDENKTSLNADNLKMVREYLKAKTADLMYQGVLCLIADALDTAIVDGDCYITIGVTKPKDAILLTVHHKGAKGRAGGLTLSEVSKDAERLL